MVGVDKVIDRFICPPVILLSQHIAYLHAIKKNMKV